MSFYEDLDPALILVTAHYLLLKRSLCTVRLETIICRWLCKFDHKIFIIWILVGGSGFIFLELPVAFTMDVSLTLDTFAVILRFHCYCKMYYKISIQFIKVDTWVFFTAFE